MTLMKIGIDIDDVLVDFFKHFIVYHNKTHGTSFKLDEVREYDPTKVWGGKRPEWESKIIQFYGSRIYKDMKPIKNSLKAIKTLKKKHELFIITSRYDITENETIKWLEKHYPKTFSQVHFTYSDPNFNKGNICKKLGIDIMIDDHIGNAVECAKKGITVFLLHKPWNKNKKLRKHIKKVNSWDEILKEIKMLKRH